MYRASIYKAHVVLICTDGVLPSYLLVIVASGTMNHIVDMCSLTKFQGDWIYFSKKVI